MDLECYKLQVASTNIEQHKMKKKNITSQDLELALTICKMWAIDGCQNLGFRALNVWSLTYCSITNYSSFNDHSLMSMTTQFTIPST